MLVKTEVVQEMKMSDLVDAFLNAEPKEFASFWFSFYEKCKPEMLDLYAKEMAPDMGGGRKKAFRELIRLINYYEEFNNRANND